ncbi:hypothetical protein EG835_14010, partial [bacterium]|nr:hypothetical protein [bacterium]
MNPTDHAHGTVPVLTGTHNLASQPGSPGTYVTPSDVPLMGESTLLVEFSLHGFPLEEYCRFARPRADGLPRTFTSFEFSKNPPGTRVGPWPGWRGIPDLPRLDAAHGAVKTGLQMMFWGDEFSTRRVRGVARLEGAGNGRISVTTPDPRLVPERVSVYRTRAIRAHTHPLTLRPDLVGLHPRLLVTPGAL